MTAEDSKGTVTRTFDALNGVTSYTDTLGNTVGYEYDCVGNLSKLTYPDNTEVIYEYDKNNNLVKVTDWAGRVTTYTYDSNNRVTGVKKPDGSVTTTAYDAAGRAVSTVENIGTTTISGFEYVYDELGRISSESDLANRLKLCYTYDDLSRVIKREAISLDNNNNLISSEEFGYDHAGNLSTDEYVYDTNNRLIGYNGTSLVYDLDGNLLTASEMSLGYDFANRLVRANEYEYTYDVENIRTKKCIGESITEYTHNANSKLSQLLTKTENNVTTKYVYGLGLIYEDTAGTAKVYHYDYRGSTVALTDTDGNVTDRFAYDTYGKLTTRTGTSSTPFLYNGRDGVMTDENGLVYMRARYYSPTFKRFINADVIAGSITNAITLNRYAYANGNPVSNVDPFGLSAERGAHSGILIGELANQVNGKLVDFDFTKGFAIYEINGQIYKFGLMEDPVWFAKTIGLNNRFGSHSFTHNNEETLLRIRSEYADEILKYALENGTCQEIFNDQFSNYLLDFKGKTASFAIGDGTMHVNVIEYDGSILAGDQYNLEFSRYLKQVYYTQNGNELAVDDHSLAVELYWHRYLYRVGELSNNEYLKYHGRIADIGDKENELMSERVLFDTFGRIREILNY